VTRKSKRSIERALEALQNDGDLDDGTEIEIRETVVGTDWSGGDLDPGETVEATERIEL